MVLEESLEFVYVLKEGKGAGKSSPQEGLRAGCGCDMAEAEAEANGWWAKRTFLSNRPSRPPQLSSQGLGHSAGMAAHGTGRLPGDATRGV